MKKEEEENRGIGNFDFLLQFKWPICGGSDVNVVLIFKEVCGEGNKTKWLLKFKWVWIIWAYLFEYDNHDLCGWEIIIRKPKKNDAHFNGNGWRWLKNLDAMRAIQWNEEIFD